MNQPCPMCGVIKTQEEEERENREHASTVSEAFIKGRRSIKKLSVRENEILDCIIDLGMDFDQAAVNFGINKKTIYYHWENAIDKVRNL